MNEQPNNTMSPDEQELAKVLEDINQQVDQQVAQVEDNKEIKEVKTVNNVETNSNVPEAQLEPIPQPLSSEPSTQTISENDVPFLNEALPPNEIQAEKSTSPDSLKQLKNSALRDLRPLVDKIGLRGEEKFEVLLLLIRSTDAQELVESAYQAAREIKDEQNRAKALLDIVKEADYFLNKKQ